MGEVSVENFDDMEESVEMIRRHFLALKMIQVGMVTLSYFIHFEKSKCLSEIVYIILK